MARDEAYRRHHRERVINNRLKRIKQVFGGSWNLAHKGPGWLDKCRMTDCSCLGCQPNKYRWERAKHKLRT